jgi:hypothetical protein
MQKRATDAKATEAQGIIYTARPDITPETEAETLASVYRFLLDSHAAKKDATDRAIENPQGVIR